MGLEASVFNEVVTVAGVPRVFNTRRQVALSEGLSRKLLAGLPLTAVEQHLAVSAGVQVPAGCDEQARLRAEYGLLKHNSSLLSLIVAPSYRCNCACPDCFQAAFDKHTVMDADTRAAVAELLAHAIAMRNPARAILWLSGGEPFACASEGLDIVNRARTRCAQGQVPLTAAATTNGTLLARGTGRELARALDLFYVSLSESPEAQRRQRPFVGGGSSFDAVFDGLALLAEWNKQVIVRFNVASGSAGCEHVRLLLLQLHERLGAVHPGFSFEFSSLLCFKEKCFSDPLTAREARHGLAAMADALQHLAEATPWPRSAFRLPAFDRLPGLHADEHFEICDFLRGDGFYVTPRGDLYLCTTKAHDPRWRLGDVRRLSAPFFDARFARVLNFDPWQDEHCAACACLPLCLTKCPLWNAHGLGFYAPGCRAANQARIAAMLAAPPTERPSCAGCGAHP